MSRFLTELDARLIKNDKVWKLLSPLVYESGVLGGKITVPIGFESDLSSVPRVPFIYMLWGGKAHREGILHDFLYRIDSSPVVTYSQANEAFYEAMNCRGKAAHIRYPMFWGVVLGGWTSWHKRKVGDRL